MNINYKIIKSIGKLNNISQTSKEINLVQWNDRLTYIDIRRWSNGEAKKGIALSLSEAKKLQTLLGLAIQSLEGVVSNQVGGADYSALGVPDLTDKDVEG